MSQVLESSDSIRYAALRLRLRAALVDVAICLGVFVAGAIMAAALLEKNTTARMATISLLVVIVLAYEPVLVACYGGTVGHRALNIRVVEAGTEHNLPILRAAIRSVVKQFFGLFSFMFMFVTGRAQGLHDLAAGSAVRILDPRRAATEDYYVPAPIDSRSVATPLVRIAVVGLCLFLLLVVTSVVAALSVSSACLDDDICSHDESQAMSVLGAAWVIASGVVMVLGWTGRLPGCRSRRA